MKLLIDMNLSPLWVELLQQSGWEALHWSDVGDPGARDSFILNWAHKNEYILYT